VLELTFSGCEYPKQMRVHGSSHFASNLEESLQLKTPYFVAVDPNTANIVVSDWANNDIKVRLDNACSRTEADSMNPMRAGNCTKKLVYDNFDVTQLLTIFANGGFR